MGWLVGVAPELFPATLYSTKPIAAIDLGNF